MFRNRSTVLISVFMYEAYLISRFFKITAQTKEFPTALVMTNVNITVVTATPAESDITAVFSALIQPTYMKTKH